MPTASAAAALMAKFGLVPSQGAYAYLQSSAMGGYGGALVQGVTRAGSGVVGASQWLNSYYRRGQVEPSKVEDDDAAAADVGEEATTRGERVVEVVVDEPATMKAKL